MVKRKELGPLPQPQALSPDSLPQARAGAENCPGFPEAPHAPAVVAKILERKTLAPNSQRGSRNANQEREGL